MPDKTCTENPIPIYNMYVAYVCQGNSVVIVQFKDTITI